MSNETTVESRTEETIPQSQKATRNRKWSSRNYYVINAETGNSVVSNLKSEKACRDWIASEESELNIQYYICYMVMKTEPVTKTTKTILK